MRDVGLLEVETDAQGTVGRPQHRYSLAADAPSLGLEPPTFPLMAGCSSAWPPPPVSAPTSSRGRRPGREQGRRAAAPPRESAGMRCRSRAELAELGFDPAVADDGPRP